MASSDSSTRIDNTYAITLKSLHITGNPVILTNIYNPASTTALLSLNTNESPHVVKAVATTSYAIASSFSVDDASLTLDQNNTAISDISPLVRAAGVPLTVDLQDGYGDQLTHALEGIIKLGAVGANIEDSYPEKGFGNGFECLRSLEESTERIRTAVRVAAKLGVPDFVVNARTDVLRLVPRPQGWSRDMLLEEVVKRGKAYLQAGATCVFVWGGAAGVISTAEVKVLVRSFEGKLAVKLADGEGDLSAKQLAEIGVCRISMGAGLLSPDMEKLKTKANRILHGGKAWDPADQ